MLKSCPFCGGVARVELLPHADENPREFGEPPASVKCVSCDAYVWEHSEAKAIDAWNLRASPPAGEGEVERVARAIYQDRWKDCVNIHDWDSSTLEDEHPGTRDEYLQAARAAISALSPWLPIEQAPRDGTPVLAIFWWMHDAPGGPFPVYRCVEWDAEENEGWLVHGEGLDYVGDTPTHYMPLPTPPSAGESR